MGKRRTSDFADAGAGDAVGNKPVSGRIALITGASQRIGKAMAEHLAHQGWSVAIHYNHSAELAAELAARLSEQYPQGRFRLFRADLLQEAETEKLLPAVIQEMGVPQLLINNASIFEPAQLKETSSGFFDRQMAVNFKAPFLLIRDFAVLCRKGVIVNLTDTRITANKSDFAAYTLAKKSLWELTKMAAFELGPDIRVNALAPGLTLAPAHEGEAYLQKLAAGIVLKRPGGVEPILKSLNFILENDYLTGQLLFCDGGENLGKTI